MLILYGTAVCLYSNGTPEQCVYILIQQQYVYTLMDQKVFVFRWCNNLFIFLWSSRVCIFGVSVCLYSDG